jgi:hypothetical protein
MANVLNDEKRQQVEALGWLGWSLRRIQRETAVRRETASAYLKAAGIDVRGHGGAKPKPATSDEVITDSISKPATSDVVITDSDVSKPATPEPVITDSVTSSSLCEPYRELITRWLDDHRTATSIFQELVEKHGFTTRYATVQRFVRKLHGETTPEARVVIATHPGEESQVDYGDGPMARESPSGSKRTRLFLLTLAQPQVGASADLEVVDEDLGGAATRTSLSPTRRRHGDGRARQPARGRTQARRLRSAAQSTLSRCPRALRRRRVAVSRARSGSQRQGRVRHRAHAKGAAWFAIRNDRGSADRLDHWDERWADTRIHGTTKRQVGAMFADERPHLRTLPLEPFRYYAFGERVVHLDGFVEVAAAYYAPPPGWIGRKVNVQWDEQQVRLLDPKTNALLREHRVADRGRMQVEDRPSRTPPEVSAYCCEHTASDAQPARSRTPCMHSMVSSACVACSGCATS